MTHAARALQSHDLSGRELNYGSHTYFFDHARTWRASPDEWSAQCRSHLRDSVNIKDNAHQAHTQVIPTRRIWNDDDDGQMIFGELGGLKFPYICLTSEEKKPEKTSPRKPVPTGDRTRARCVTAHATTCSTAVDKIELSANIISTCSNGLVQIVLNFEICSTQYVVSNCLYSFAITLRTTKN